MLRLLTPRPLLAMALAALAWPAQAWVLQIGSAPAGLYLQVGAGTNNGNNATVNTVSVSVPAAQVGTGPLQMTSDSTVANSFYDNYAVCNPPQQVYIGVWFRRAGGGGVQATLTVTTPAVLSSGADTIPFSSISWLSTSNGNNGAADIPSGTFTAGAQTLRSVARNTWVENCLVFSYANNAIIAAGTYTGRATYTAVMP